MIINVCKCCYVLMFNILFQCLTLSNKYKRGKLLAYQLLCQMMVRQPDVTLAPELLAKFYQVLHEGLTSQDQVCLKNRS